MFKVRVHLHQLLGNYAECLQLFFRIQAIREDVFAWLREVRQRLDAAEVTRLRALLAERVPQFVEMDASQTIRLAEAWLDSDHLRLLEGLNDDQAFRYLGTLLAEREAQILREF